MYDVIIVGSGPAGVSASLYLKRANKKVLIISKGYGALKKASKVENYYGIEGKTGEEIHNIGIKQAKNMEIEIVQDEVVNIIYNNEFEVITVNRNYKSKYVILATGTNRQTPPIKGIKEFEGKGVSYCAICDAFFYKNKDVAILGNGNYAIHEAMQLKPIVKSITILTNGERMTENRDLDLDLKVNEEPIREFRGIEKINEVEFENNNKQHIDGVFVAIGIASSSDLARKIGAMVSNNNIVVNENMETTVPKLYACGDCTGGLLQINKAVYEGAKAALSIIKSKN